MSDISFKFRLKLGNFEFEVEGERGFVERTVSRYEGRFLPKFQHLIDKIQVAEVAAKPAGAIQPEPVQQQERPQQERQQHDRYQQDRQQQDRQQHQQRQPHQQQQSAPPPPQQQQQSQQQPPPHAKPPQDQQQRGGDNKRFDKGSSRRGGRDRRGRNNNNNRNFNNRVMPAPTLPDSQEIIRQPYIPEGFEPSSPHDEDQQPLVQMDAREEETRQVDVRPEPTPVPARQLAVVTDEELEEGDGPSVIYEGDQSDTAMKRFYETLDPKTHHEKVMVMAYFIQVKRGSKEFGTGKIKTCYDMMGADPAGNINQVLNHASRTGFVTKTQRGRSVKYSLTSKGKQFVEKGLTNG